MSRQRTFRRGLAVLLAFFALNAFAGGLYAMVGAKAVPVGWLDGSPFSSYFVPGVFLFAVVGGTCALAAIAVLARWSLALELAALAGSIVMVWIAIQMAVIGFVSWMQPATACAGVLILLLVLGLEPRHAVSAWRTR